MDITNVFKACVKTIRTRNKAFGLKSENEKSTIFHVSKQKTDFSKNSKEVLGQVSRLRDFLLEHKKAYLNFSSFIPECPRLTDNERDKIDTGAQIIMTSCSQLIQKFKQESLKIECSLQLMEHQKAVVELIENYFKIVCKIYFEQRAIRLKRTLENKNISKLKCETTKKDKVFTAEKTYNINNYEEFSPEELQVFEAENVQLLDDITGLSEEVKKVEGVVVKIAQLQEIFTDKVFNFYFINNIYI